MSAEPPRDPTVIAFFSEIVMVEQLARTRLTRVLPRGMELSHFMVLNHFARLGGERTPAQLARAFHVTRGAMTQHPRAGSTPRATSTSGPTGRTAAPSGSRSAPPGSRPATAPSPPSRRSSTTWSAASGSTDARRPARAAPAARAARPRVVRRRRRPCDACGGLARRSGRDAGAAVERPGQLRKNYSFLKPSISKGLPDFTREIPVSRPCTPTARRR